MILLYRSKWLEIPSLSSEHALEPDSHCMALTRLQSPCILFVFRGQPVFSNSVLMKLLEWFSGGCLSAERTRSASVSWPGLQVPLLSWVEGFTVSVEGTRLSRRNNGTQNTESFIQKHISTLSLSQVCL